MGAAEPAEEKAVESHGADVAEAEELVSFFVLMGFLRDKDIGAADAAEHFRGENDVEESEEDEEGGNRGEVEHILVEVDEDDRGADEHDDDEDACCEGDHEPNGGGCWVGDFEAASGAFRKVFAGSGNACACFSGEPRL